MIRRRAEVPRSLAGSELARKIPWRELRRVERLGTPVWVAAGRSVIREDGPGRECFVVVDGEFRVERRDRFLAVVGPGEFVGEMALLDLQPRTATVTAVRDSTVWAFTRREFATLMYRCPVLAAHVRGVAGVREGAMAA